MSDQENNQSKKSSAMPVIIAVLVVLSVIVIAGLMASNKKASTEIAGQESSHPIPSPVAAIEESPAVFQEAEKTENTPEIMEVAHKSTYHSSVSRVDPENPYSARILGDPNAPLKISEHSAFTCGHCKSFHETNYIKIKKDYIDTGKAYLVFNDFPISDVGIKVGAVARCLPDQVYFNFVQLMFTTQNQWKSYHKYIPYLKQNTRMLGLSEEKFEECLNSEEIKKIITDEQEKAHKTHGVKSTPTLVLNDSVTILGLSPYKNLQTIFDDIIAQAEKDEIEIDMESEAPIQHEPVETTEPAEGTEE